MNRATGDDDIEANADLPPTLVDRILTLQKYQEEETDLLMAYKIERLKLEAKFQQLRVPLYDKRSAVINGSNTVTVPEIAPRRQEDAGNRPVFNSIPGFWLQVLANHPSIGTYIEERDADVLASLQDIRCIYSEDMSSFTLRFTFAENEYFTNKELLKEYYVDPDLLDDQCPTLASIVAPTPIEWKGVDKNVTLGRAAGGSLYVPKLSFFHFFDAPRAEVGDVGGPDVASTDEIGVRNGRINSTGGGIGGGRPSDASVAVVRKESVATDALGAEGMRGPSFGGPGDIGLGGGRASGSSQLSSSSAMAARVVDTSSGLLDIGGSPNGPTTTIDLLKLSIPQDYEMAHIIRTSIVPFAIGWYTGAMVDDDDEDEDED